ncbi:GNAT superfamily N-acetyltransferase [Desulfobaculum xiamenense]|uniref:GNAT superfamily N-acetyltransferase n=1 Tax=Desulfobaculum xiamenense TaxID=995050 RepID=A0A846QPR0_9BACT|nr:GNAT family N-acetyltransferase [Desulfobaculum xiamenense]NJB68303.1 GNAT superfamily N-acetyltransferase [Desulfobaculum xiamenense]
MKKGLDFEFRRTVCEADVETVTSIVTSSGFFTEEEIEIAASLVRERLEFGPSTGYEFLFADAGGQTLGYACYGPTDDDPTLYDLYWIAMQDRLRGYGVGTRILLAVEELVRHGGGTVLRIETSSQPLYTPTRAFYEGHGYTLIDVTEDFYAPGDARCTYTRNVWEPVGGSAPSGAEVING